MQHDIFFEGGMQANEGIESAADQASDAAQQAGAKVNDTARDAAASAEGATDGAFICLDLSCLLVWAPNRLGLVAVHPAVVVGHTAHVHAVD